MNREIEVDGLWFSVTAHQTNGETILDTVNLANPSRLKPPNLVDYIHDWVYDELVAAIGRKEETS